MYKDKLISLLEGLECQNIDELIEKSPEHLRATGAEITKHSKISNKGINAILTPAALDSEGVGLGYRCPVCQKEYNNGYEATLCCP